MWSWIQKNKKITITILIFAILFIGWRYGYIDSNDIHYIIDMLKEIVKLVKDILSAFTEFLVEIGIMSK